MEPLLNFLITTNLNLKPALHDFIKAINNTGIFPLKSAIRET